MTRVDRRRVNTRLDRRGEAHTTSGESPPTNILDQAIPPRLAEPQGGAAEHGPVTCVAIKVITCIGV